VLTTVYGDIFTSYAQTLVNPVNTVGVMGAGLARAFKDRYPEMYQAYREACAKGLLAIGSLQLFQAHDHWIINFPTKVHYRDPSELPYIAHGLCAIRQKHESWGIEALAIPALGCGLGGLQWSDVYSLIVQYLGDLPLSVLVYPPLKGSYE